jgi:hypothetical protein
MRRAWDALLAIGILLGLLVGLAALPFLLVIGVIYFAWLLVYCGIRLNRGRKEGFYDRYGK